MKNFIWAVIFLFALAGCEPVEPVNTALSWTAEEQCQTWNRWSYTGPEAFNLYQDLNVRYSTALSRAFLNTTGDLSSIGQRPEIVSGLRLHAPLNPFNSEGFTVTGRCPDDNMIAVYGPAI